MRRTFNELFAYFKRDITQSYKDNVKHIRFIELYESSRPEWQKLKIKDVEQTELLSRDLDVFYRSTVVGNVGEAKKSEIEKGERLRFVMAVHGDFKLSCNGKQNIYTLPIQPRGKDVLFAMLSDPFRQPDDANPVYTETADADEVYYKVFSRNAPENLTFHWIKYPEPFNLITNPEGTTEEDESAQNEIVKIALKKFFASIDDFNSASTMERSIAMGGD